MKSRFTFFAFVFFAFAIALVFPAPAAAQQCMPPGAPNVAQSSFSYIAPNGNRDNSDPIIRNAGDPLQVRITVRDSNRCSLNANVTFTATEHVDFGSGPGNAHPCSTGGAFCEAFIRSNRPGEYFTNVGLAQGVVAALTYQFALGPPSRATSSVEVTPDTSLVVGNTFTLTATILDQANNVHESEAVNFADTAGVTFSSATCTTDAAGMCSVTATSATAGSYSTALSAVGVGGIGPAVYTFASDAAVASASAVAASPSSAAAGADIVLTATVRDVHNNLVSAGTTVGFAATENVAFDGGGAGAAATCDTDDNGVCSVTATSTVVGNYSTAASIGATNFPAAAAYTFTSAAVDAGTSSVGVSGSPAMANGSEEVTLTATVLDAHSNAVAGKTVTFAATTDVSFSSETCVTDNSGVCSVRATSVSTSEFSTDVTVDGVIIGTAEYIFGADEVEVLRELNKIILPEVARVLADRSVSVIAQRVQQARRPSQAAGLSLGLAEVLDAHGEALAKDERDFKSLLTGSDFVLSLNAADGGSGGVGPMAFWGSGEHNGLEGESGNLDWDGDVTGIHIGVDGYLNEKVLAGVAVSWLQSDLDYKGDRDRAGTGRQAVDLTSVHPYLGWSVAWADLWTTVGYGRGELEIKARDKDTHKSDLDLRTFGIGASHAWVEGVTTMRLKGEVLRTEMDVEGGDAIASLKVDVTRLRLSLEAGRSHVLDAGGLFEPSVEVGVRRDGGDGDGGGGVEIGGGVRYRDPASGVILEGRARALLTTLLGRSSDYKEWGIEGHLSLQPGADGLGLSVNVSPGYGDSSSGVAELWEHGLTESEEGDATDDYQARLDMRVGYGLSLRGFDGVLTPYSEMTLGNTDSYRMGMVWRLSPELAVKLLGERRDPEDDPAEHALLLEGEIQF